MTGSEQESYALNKTRVRELEARRQRIRELNDTLRTQLRGGRLLLTTGITSLDAGTLSAVLTAVQEFTTFTADNDPHDEHDFGSIQVGSMQAYWKVDYYDLSLEYGSPDPGDPEVTARVLTVMLASEY